MFKEKTVTDKTKSVSEVAFEFNVSEATVRNWIKTSVLDVSNDKRITQKSIDNFVKNIAGKQKLNSRANKLHKDAHNHKELSLEIQQKIEQGIDLYKLGEKYENSLSDSYRNSEGIYYTPDFIVRDMMIGFEENLSEKTFLDPCCGSGNFILEAIKKGFKPENVFGFDLDKNAVEITKKRIFEQTGYISENIVVADFLNESLKEKKRFDYIFTNPPWGKKISKELKQKYSKDFEAGKSTDTASLFFFASLSILQKNGKLGFLLPDSFFNISVFEQARKKALEYKIDRLVDYKKPFKGLMTKACAIILSNSKPNNDTEIQCNFDGKTYSRNLKSFVSTPKSIFNFWIDQKQSEVIGHIFEFPHITLQNKAQWGLGVVTGNNKEFCKPQNSEGLMPVYKGSDISKKGLKKPTVFIPENLGLYQQVAPKQLYEAKEKLIYKFISSDLCFHFDNSQKYVLNSANIIVLKKDFPINGKSLSQLLSSDFMNWVFRKTFATHKVLKSDLQSLPIHFGYFQKHGNFVESKYLDYLGIQKSEGTYVLL